ncbi:hypothetical protein JYK02_28675 [Corallococcus macrosporus]|uniref:GNAT family N-acetyltransferase n=1 Tax=Corallococcus macrosporus TaxID=35 RepID=A0ABS3DJK5_9BACT|nr:hypothetical protein [Corallococcus macrosporus]MBN8231494.1 hypothetical protein [Corallococcus macrosporus]
MSPAPPWLPAVRNNADWCDAVCRAHGRPGRFEPGLWLNPAPVPAFYPNAVTLTAGPPEHTRQALSRLDPPGRWGVKDSFATLDLSALGFDVLFEARWIHLEATASVPDPASGLEWRTVRTPAELEAWEAAWSGLPEGARPGARVFPPALLQEEGVVFLAAGTGARPLAGGIASFASGAVGLSNTFRAEGAPSSLDAELVARIRARFPGQRLVGYEHGEALDAWCAVGFQPGGPLRVWLKREG